MRDETQLAIKNDSKKFGFFNGMRAPLLKGNAKDRPNYDDT